MAESARVLHEFAERELLAAVSQRNHRQVLDLGTFVAGNGVPGEFRPRKAPQTLTWDAFDARLLATFWPAGRKSASLRPSLTGKVADRRTWAFVHQNGCCGELLTTFARACAGVLWGSTHARFASPAVEPAAPVPSKSLQKVVLAGVGGFVFAVGIVVLVDFVDPDFDPKEVLGRLRRAGAS